jgi:hypothetical protein
MAATKGIPIKAFEGQNHDAHIQSKMAYLQDPQNGANPIMARIKPILESNIQEHSVMKYQEQVNGMTRLAMEQLPPEAMQNPSVAEMAMAQAAQQVLNANQALGQAQSPEQQLVALEQAKVELEKEKLKIQSAKFSAESALDAQELELKEAKLMTDSAKAGQAAMMKKEKSDLDRASKESMKAIDAMTKAAIADQKTEVDYEKIKAQSLSKLEELNIKDDKERSLKLVEILTDLIKHEENINLVQLQEKNN